MAETLQKGTLYVVATPIGNLGDISTRAAWVLAGVDRVLAEDTRQTRRLLEHLDLHKTLTPLHEHNEDRQLAQVLEWLRSGEMLALVSDAGTPLISDPGFALVRAAREQGLPLVTIPGASAVTAALAVAGLPTDRFVFEGFLPPKAGARRRALEALGRETRTMVFYESPRRVAGALADMAGAFGGSRVAVVARELTKAHEQSVQGTLAELADQVADGRIPLKGEFVLMVAGAEAEAAGLDVEVDHLLVQLLTRLSVSDAARMAARITGQGRGGLYQRALALQNRE
ncbi:MULTISPECIES: 16S rRNA (cytidine(1402)-2'-O)-methyltransferase [Gammaproteobacteria]|uniref:Ribosomal RNA small subunit methyltransferase I n=1 Tax=Vreelandella halophila TaxID=86177 RepID=A0A9X5B5N1_9GAMM|nr:MULTISPECIES: 16S rRNA (cytidine(1402)-2'-O)-methyltransferase [Gammaproteobacteria]KAA8980673.1 16S rRNA (cytidine(1402)-2'-O)-methyltransferase [Halospina sp. K52047b]MYL26668.1 16S rRNA (cytidine(1402)-2'-O)-methyltransferase [Halomonas utahensis]MYL74005.1 16S rRNA (cytidine(1402)-2'-O)-methyltransferase [Halomonas sp. 22501_18_FS]